MKIALLLLAGALAACPAKPKDATEPHHHGRHFEDAEKWAKLWDDPARDAWQRPADVISLLRLEPGMTAADIGAGTGYFIPHLSRAVGASGKVLALDIEPDMVRYLKERAAREGLTNVLPQQVTPEDPKLPAASVHRILCVNTWHHIGARVEYSKRLARSLAQGGMIFIVDFTLESDIGPPVEERLKPEQVAEELRAAGLVAEILEEPLEKQYIVVGKLP
jgi:ubiquinone/menaquinone biosynthesis C-methylase UbiE